MDARPFAIGTVLGGITVFVTGFVLFALPPLADFYLYAMTAGSATGVPRETPLVWAVFLGSLSYGVLVTLAIGSLYRHRGHSGRDQGWRRRRFPAVVHSELHAVRDQQRGQCHDNDPRLAAGSGAWRGSGGHRCDRAWPSQHDSGCCWRDERTADDRLESSASAEPRRSSDRSDREELAFDMAFVATVSAARCEEMDELPIGVR